MKLQEIAGYKIPLAFPPSDNQRKVGEALIHGKKNIVVDSKAGTGKTTLIQMMTRLILEKEPLARIAVIAFNEKIVREIASKMPTKVYTSTSHALGKRILEREAEKRAQKVKIHKVKKSEVLFHYATEELGWNLNETKFKEKYTVVFKLISLAKLNLATTAHQITEIAELHGLEVLEGEPKIVLDVIRKLNRDIRNIDFDDMVYLPNVLKEIDTPKFDYVFVDECQDLNKAQQGIMKICLKPVTGRFIAVGDPDQCQPEGTLISLNDGSLKPIEEIKKGDRLIGYNGRSKCQVVGRYIDKAARERYVKHAPEVLSTSSRVFTGNLYKIHSGGRTSTYTGNHICYAKWAITEKFKYALYLMQKGENFRVGIYKILGKPKGNFGINAKSRAETADKTWILKIYETKGEAYLNEQIISYQYGIPQLIFKHNDQKRSRFLQPELNEFWKLYKVNKRRVIECLYVHDKNILHPFWTKGGRSYNGTKSYSEHRACNLFEKYMVVAHLHGDNTPIDKPIKTIEVIQDRRKVYSLEVSKTNNYFADGILTHNCIYGFAGADIDSFKNLQNIKNTVSLPLDECFRCTKKIIEYTRAATGSSIVAHPSCPEGEEPRGYSVNDIYDGDFVMCRTTAPLVKFCFYLLSNGKSANIVGRNIKENLIKIINKPKAQTITQFNQYLSLQTQKLITRLAKLNPEKSEEEVKELREYSEHQDIHEVFAIIARNAKAKTTSSLVAAINKIFTTDPKRGITLSTIHKAKGLEFDRCFIIEKSLMPHRSAKQEWEKVQENNLQYVCYTRAKKTLGWITDWSVKDGHEEKSVELFTEEPEA